MIINEQSWRNGRWDMLSQLYVFLGFAILNKKIRFKISYATGNGERIRVCHRQIKKYAKSTNENQF
jgi:hypothetical protein